MHILTLNGLVYSIGIDYKQYGILGMGDLNFEIREITLNKFFQKQKINYMCISEKFCVCINNQHNILIFGKFKNKKFLVPKQIVNENNLYYNKVKCSDNYFVLMDFSGHLSYYGEINSKNLIDNDLNDYKIIHKAINFDYKNEQIEDFICGNNFICILDKSGNSYLYNEDGLNKIKIQDEIKQIYLMKNSFFLLGNNSNKIHILQNNNENDNLYDFIINTYQIYKEMKIYSIIENYYYKPSEIIFIIESPFDLMIKMKENKIKLFNLTFSKDSKDNIKTIFSKKFNDTFFNLNDTYQSYLLTESVLPVNYSLSKISLNSSKSINETSKINFRINKISNLLEKVFDNKIEQINNKRARSVKRRLVFEKINGTDYDLRSNNNKDNINGRSKSGKIFSVQDSRRFTPIKEEENIDECLGYKKKNNDKKNNLNENKEENKIPNKNNLINCENHKRNLTDNINNFDIKNSFSINKSIDNSNKKDEIFSNKLNKNKNLQTQNKNFYISNAKLKILSISKSQLNIPNLKLNYNNQIKRQKIKNFYIDKSDKNMNYNKDKQTISLDLILYYFLENNKKTNQKENIKNEIEIEKEKQLEKEKEIKRLKELQRIQDLEIEKQKKIGNEKEKELNKLKALEIQKEKEIKEFQLRLSNLKNNKRNFGNTIQNNLNNNNELIQSFEQIFSFKSNNQIYNSAEKKNNFKSKFSTSLNSKNINKSSTILSEKISPFKTYKNNIQNIKNSNINSQNYNSDLKYNKINPKNIIYERPKSLINNNIKEKIYKKQIIDNNLKNSKKNINESKKSLNIEPFNLINKNIIKVNSKDILVELIQKAKDNNNSNSIYYQLEDDDSKILKLKNNKIEIIPIEKIDSISILSNKFLDDESFKLSNSSDKNRNKIIKESNYKHNINQNKRNNPIRLMDTISASSINIFKSSNHNEKNNLIKIDNFQLNKRNQKNNINNNKSKSINKFIENSNDKNFNNNSTQNIFQSKNNNNKESNFKRNATPLKYISQKGTSYAPLNQEKKGKNKFLPNKKNNFIKYNNNEKIMKAVEKLKERYLNYLQRIYGNQNIENNLKAPDSKEKENSLIRDFMNSEIKINDSEYFIPKDSFISQIEMENFLFENLKYEKIKNKIKIIDNNFIGDTFTSNQNLISFDEDEKNNSLIEPIELERSGNIITHSSYFPSFGNNEQDKFKQKFINKK